MSPPQRVADWRPAQAEAHKIKRTPRRGEAQVPHLALAENPDILATVAALPQPPLCVGFAAESQDLVKHAREKRQRKNVPLIVGNLGPATLVRTTIRWCWWDARGERELSRADKLTLARELCARHRPAPDDLSCLMTTIDLKVLDAAWRRICLPTPRGQRRPGPARLPR